MHRFLRLSAAALADRTRRSVTDGGDPKAAASHRALVRWFDGFADEIRYHHHIEDALLFPALESRVTVYGTLAPRLESDHADLDVMLDQLTAALREGNAATSASLSAGLRDHLDEHLGFEDDEISPLFARHFSAAEWDELNAKAIKMTPPKQLIFTAPWLLSYLNEAERAALLASVPKAMTLLWVLTRGRYARMTARAFGTTARASS